MRRDALVQLTDGRRAPVPWEIIRLVDRDELLDAGLCLLLLCDDCGADTSPIDGPHEYYMVHETLWAVYGAGDGYLCVGCLERRLGRELDYRDFSDVPCNSPRWDDSPRLRSRKTRPEPPAQGVTGGQFALLVDPLDDDPGPAERAAVEARIECDDRQRAKAASRAPSCRCARPWLLAPDGRCGQCGRNSR